MAEMPSKNRMSANISARFRGKSAADTYRLVESHTPRPTAYAR